jgi:hypothetical protein
MRSSKAFEALLYLILANNLVVRSLPLMLKTTPAMSALLPQLPPRRNPSRPSDYLHTSSQRVAVIPIDSTTRGNLIACFVA